MPTLPGATIPFAPFQWPVPLPLPDIGDAPLICVQLNQTWLTYLVGCAGALVQESTWDSDDENAVNVTIRRARNLIDMLASFEACPMPVQFRVNPGNSRYWDYSTDGGATWIEQPLTDISAPSDAIITDPTSLLRNTIDLASTGADGLVIKALATVGVQLQKGGIAAFFQKIPGLGLAADAVIQIAGTDGSTNAIIETILP